ncbi:MAG TPA: hypothetical protein VGR02_08585 [Thermoanaerobaculia bacterium]|jgi:hypothetical protein|nr:hypothetical protein [Thermoanaerobaculia bacterium]
MSRRALNAGTAAVFVVSFFLFAFLFLGMSILVDADSYYHLAVARWYAQEGIATPIPWARFSLLATGADKEWLFHLLLMPFTLGDAATGGRLALAALNASLAAVIARYAASVLGPVGFAVPVWLWIAAPPFLARAVRLRPELLALLLILLAIGAATRRRYVAFGLIAFAFALGYTAWHVFLFLALLWAWRDRRLALAAILGSIAGLILRPHPMATMQLWYVQNVEFFRWAGKLDVGDEIRPPSLHTLFVSSAFLLGVAGCWLLVARRRPDQQPATGNQQLAAIAAGVFLLLFTRFGRMATYVYPLLLLAVLNERARRFAPLILGGTLLLALPLAREPMLMDLLTHDYATEADLERFGRAVPPGAKIAATWGDAETYVFWAPQGRYLNVLEPLFLLARDPRAYEAQRRLFSGLDPDPSARLRELDSNFIAFDVTSTPPALLARIATDPRFRLRYGGVNALFELVPAPVQ